MDHEFLEGNKSKPDCTECVRATLRRGLHNNDQGSFTVRIRLRGDPKYIMLPLYKDSTHLRGDPKRSKLRISCSGRALYILSREQPYSSISRITNPISHRDSALSHHDSSLSHHDSSLSHHDSSLSH